ncbi:hypothetical protein X801_05235 [Opisthorchis viverrini]|uniref:ATP synthase subunit d, mitochondrial n=2 Tax=Opisthorchis viverrini TaxID=6198 RepID=A0A074ZPX1_OPIVI|nr:hypothetical protein T265_07175 [Opisthorchis viverrini]KER25375.1 hypothetical protein T265_07175 [Opisthorchis viverrini]OON18905.1 hypothetical protein X801_05235 [Opisthorchis viverrini]
MAAKRISRSAINWLELHNQCPKHQLDQFRDFKTRTDGLVSRISGLPESLPQINWDAYAHTVPVPGLVDKFRKEYENLQVEYPKDSANVLDKVKAQGQQMMDNAKRHIAVCEKMKTSANKMKNTVDNLPKIDELIPELTIAYFPLTNLDPFRTGERKPEEEKNLLKNVAPKAHWDFS